MSAFAEAPVMEGGDRQCRRGGQSRRRIEAHESLALLFDLRTAEAGSKGLSPPAVRPFVSAEDPDAA